MPITYKAIQTVTVMSSGTTTIEFTQIPETYTDLLIKVSARTDRAGTDIDDEARIRFNNNTNSVYYAAMIEYSAEGNTRSRVDAISTFSGRGHYPTNDTTGGIFGNNEYYIPNYLLSTSKVLSLDTVMENNALRSLGSIAAGESTSTTAISSIQLTAIGAFDQHSTATLYGIKNA